MKVEILAGLPWSSDFTIVSSDGVTGVELEDTDTATFSIQTAGTNVTCVIEPVDMTIIDAENGIFNVKLTDLQTALLEQEVGGQEDNYPSLNKYLAIIDCKLADGDRTATVPVFVKEVGQCQVQ
jgi:hypothetical protein